MEPQYSSQLSELKTLLKEIEKQRPVEGQKDWADGRIQDLCKSILSLNPQEIGFVDNYQLIRCMFDFMFARVEGYRDGKTAIRHCYKRIYKLLPNMRGFECQFDDRTVDALLQSYNNYHTLSKIVPIFLQLFHKNMQSETVPAKIYSQLIHLDQLDEQTLELLYKALSQSGASIYDYFNLIAKSFPDLNLKKSSDLLFNFNDPMGLRHVHLEYPSSQDTDIETSLSNGIEIEVKETDTKKILEFLSQELDGGYSLLNKAKFLLPPVYSDITLLDCIYVLKGIPMNKEVSINREEILYRYLAIQESDRDQVLSDALAFIKFWNVKKRGDINLDVLKRRMLDGIATIPEDQRGYIYQCLSTYDNYQFYNSMFARTDRGINGFIVAYLLIPDFLENPKEGKELRELLLFKLDQKLNDPHLPISTLDGLATFVLQRREELGLFGNHPLCILALKIRTEQDLSKKMQSLNI